MNKVAAPALDQIDGARGDSSAGQGDAGGVPRPKRRRRRRSGPRASTRTKSTASQSEETPGDETPAVRAVKPRQQVDPDAVAAPEAPAGEAGDGLVARTRPAGAQRRRRSRGGRSKATPSAKSAAAETVAVEDVILAEPGAADEVAPAEGDEGQAPKPRRRRRRGGRGRSGRTRTAGVLAEASSEVGAPPEETAETGEAVEVPEPIRAKEPIRPRRAPRTRQRGSTARTAKASLTGEAAVEPETAEETEPEAPQTRTARRVRSPRRRREPTAPVKRVADKDMLVTEIGERDQIAVLEDRTLVEHYITRAGARSMVGNIYLGRVQNVLPGMEAAFVDVSRGRNAVLYAGEVSYDEEIDGETPRIEHVLKAGQNVLVQVTKDPMGGKGARLTQEISLPGRYVVLVPNNPEVFGISRRLPDDERRRLKDILKKVKPAEHGLIVRTAADGADAEDLQGDLERLAVE